MSLNIDQVLPGEESVWDYPRPPRVEATSRRVQVVAAGLTIADTVYAVRVLETSHPPAYYVPREDVRTDLLHATGRRSVCEFKGEAVYWSLTVDGREFPGVAWSYPAPWPGYEALRDHLSFYPGRVDASYLDDVPVTPQAGGFYGGWITPEIVGPFKGAPGTRGW